MRPNASKILTRENAVSWRIERFSPFFVKRARSISGSVKVGLRRVCLMSGPRASEVKPGGDVSYFISTVI
jgi:hypothetical protein